MSDTLHSKPEQSPEEIAAALRAEAEKRWGPERAEGLAPVIEETAGNIWRVSHSELAPEDEPDFYSQ